MKLSTTAPDVEKKIDVEVDYDVLWDEADEAVRKSKFVATMKRELQAAIRGWLRADKDPEEIQELASAWRPKLAAQRGDPEKKKNKTKKYLQSLSPEERAELLDWVQSLDE